MKEITIEEAKDLKVGTEYIVFNQLTNSMKIEIASPVDIVHNKHCYNKLQIYIKGKDDYKDMLDISIKQFNELKDRYEKLKEIRIRAIQYLKDNHEYQEDLCDECIDILKGVE